MFHQITAQDHRLMRRVNSWYAPRWIRLWMVAATKGGDGWLWYAIGLAILLFGGQQRLPAIAAACTASAMGSITFVLLKRKIGRRRPCEIAQHCWANLLPPDQFSFPSGHTINAFAVAIPFGFFYPSLLVGVIFCAVSVAISRILLGMHFLSDVLAGALLGAGFGYFAFSIYS